MAFFWSGSIAVTDTRAVSLWGDLPHHSAESLCPSGGSPVAGLWGWGWGSGGRKKAGLKSDPEEEEMVSLFHSQAARDTQAPGLMSLKLWVWVARWT